MGTNILSETLTRLGLASGSMSEIERVPIALPNLAPQGFSGESGSAGAATLAAIANSTDARFDDLGVEVLRTGDWQLQRNYAVADIYLLTTRDPVRPQIRVLEPVDSQAQAFVADDGGILFDVGHLPPVTLIGRYTADSANLSDAIVLTVLADKSLQVQTIAATPISVLAIPPLISDVEAWAARSGEAWLTTTVAELVATGHAYDHCCAVALTMRYAIAPIADLAAEVARWLAGTAMPGVSAEQLWARALAPAQHDQIAGQACAHSEFAASDLTVLTDEPETDDPAWVAAIDRILIARDHLEGVRVLLQQSHETPLLDAHLAELDLLGQALVVAMQWQPGEHEHLLAAAAHHPDEWWTQPTSHAYIDETIDELDSP